MNSDLESYRLQILSIRQDVPGIWNGLSEAQFNWRPAPGKWSIAECLEHLNETARKTLPTLDDMIARGRSQGLTSDGPFVLGLLERMFIKSLEPPPGFRAKAPKRIAPRPATSYAVAEVSQEFQRLQEALDARLEPANGLHLTKIKGPSPAFPMLKWSLGGMLSITLAHERRHVWQAREVRNHPQFPRA